MGLDMYLFAQTRGEPIDPNEVDYENIHWRHPDWENEGWYREAEGERDRALQFTKVAYWRKANQVHAWFVDHVQGGVDECQYAQLRLEQLVGLKTTCERILADPTTAEFELPPRAGFFFGSTNVDEYYLNGLRETVQQIEAIELVERERHEQGLLSRPLWYHASW